MNTINVDDIGVVSLSVDEELEIAGGWSWIDLGAAAFGGAAGGAAGGAVVGMIVPGAGTAAGAVTGAISGFIGGIVGYAGYQAYVEVMELIE